jgi:hypothetical protein
MQFHSLVISEPLAVAGGILVGLGGYGIARLLNLEMTTAHTIGNAFAVIVTLLVGGKVNLVMLDLLGLIIARPITALCAPSILSACTG